MDPSDKQLFSDTPPRRRQLTGYAGPELDAMAWLVANAFMEDRLADNAAAITDAYYYIILVESYKGKDRLEDSHAVNDYGAHSRKREIWRVARSAWGPVGSKGFKTISKAAKKLMRKLPPASPGDSGRI